MVPINVLHAVAAALGFPQPNAENCRWHVEHISAGDADTGYRVIACNCTRSPSESPTAVALSDVAIPVPAPVARPGRPARLRFHRFRAGRCRSCGTVFCFALPTAMQP